MSHTERVASSTIASARGPRGRILIVDDEADIRDTLGEILKRDGYEVFTACSGRIALAQYDQNAADVVLTDLCMGDMDGIELVELGRRRWPHAAFVVMTARASIGTAVRAMQKGAETYLEKPLGSDVLRAVVARALEKAQLSKEAARLREEVAVRYSFDRILGDHPVMQQVLKQVGQVATSRATVLIHGESGTGKELIASALHHASNRRDRPFVRLNCASLAESLLESELFGHEKGAFTGALARREGRFAQADEGTLFLDEVSEIPMPLQVKLLRFLQEREFERVGGNETVRVDVRIVAATNRDLQQRIRDGAFREDLYYRLNVIKLEMPPLRSRRSDIPLLAQSFLKRFAEENGRAARGFTPEALRYLCSYSWPGNVRELENAVERAVVMSTGEFIAPGDLVSVITEQAHGDELDLLVPGITMDEVERIVILRTLGANNGSTGKTADILGISRRKIQYRLKEWGLAAHEVSDLPYVPSSFDEVGSSSTKFPL